MQDIAVEKVTELNLIRDTKTDIVKIGLIAEGKMYFQTQIRFRLNNDNTVTAI